MTFDPEMKVLVADSLESMRKLVKNMLFKSGIKNIEYAEDGEKAWEMIQENGYDLILSEWKLPKEEGITLLRRVRASKRPELKETPFVIFSSENSKERIVEAVHAKVSGYLVKPFSHDVLEQKINQLFP